MSNDLVRELLGEDQRYGHNHYPQDKSSGKLTATSLVQLVKTAAKEWEHRQTNPDWIKARVNEILDRNARGAIMAVLGFREDFGRVEIDNRNAGTNPLKAMMAIRAAETVNEFIDAHKDDIKRWRSEIDEAIKNSYIEIYRREFREQLGKMAREKAISDAQYVINVVGYDPDEVRKILSERIPDDKPYHLIPEDHCDRVWASRGILKAAEFIGFVRLLDDGSLSADDMDVPGTPVFAVLTLTAIIGGFKATIISDGDKWHPISPVITMGTKITYSGARRVDQFEFKHELIFNLMNEADHEMIKHTINKEMLKSK